jgi:uncharacterized protein (DUF1800 family)
MPQADRHLIAHLLRRAGFGASQAEMDEYTALGYEGAVDRLINYERVDDSTAEAAVERMRRDNPAAANPEQPARGNPPLEAAIWLARMLLTRRPLQEKMTLYWHGFLVSSVAEVNSGILMARQNALFRSRALTTSYKDLVKAVARDGAMIVYLDNNTNRKGKPNENWARELMELFTLGIGNYTENDVKEAARAFTGWTLNRETGDFVFNARQHDDDPKTVLGVTGNLNGDDVIEILFTQPAHGRFFARRLLRHFLTDTPSEALVNRFAQFYVTSGFNVKETMRQLFLSQEFRAPEARFALVKSPVEFTIGAMRTLNANLTDLRTWRTLMTAMAAMGQQVYLPPDVGGWPGGRSWFNSSTYYNRANTALALVSIENNTTVDPTEIANARGLNTPQAAVDYFLELLAQSDVAPAYRTELLKFTGPTFRDNRDRDGKLRGLVRLIMSSPAYQMN